MKKVYLLAMMLLCSMIAFSQVKKVAILEIVDKEGKVSYAQKLMLRASMAKGVTQAAGYEAYDRTDIDAIMGEHNFQRTGMVNEDQIRQLGEMTGAAYILITEVARVDNNNIFVTAKILDVETARTERTDYLEMGVNAMLEGCEQLVAKLLGLKGSGINKNTRQTLNTELISSTQQNMNTTIMRVGKEYSYNGKYLNKQEYQHLLVNTCPKAYAQYKKGKTLIGTGWGLCAGGLGLIFGVGLPMTFAVYSSPTLYTVACAITISSVPMLCIGYLERDKRSIETFNRQCAKPAITYNITAGQNGVGLAINF